MNSISRISPLVLFYCLLGACGQEDTADAGSPNKEIQAVQTQPVQPQAVQAQQVMATDPKLLSGMVVSTQDGGGYTFVEIETGDDKVWAAGPVSAVTVGAPITISNQMPMSDFHSATLERSFDLIYFVTSLQDPAAGGTDATADLTNLHANVSTQPAITVTEAIERAEGGKTITEIIADAGSLAGQKVRVRGKVVKLTPAILGKDWIHISDGKDTDLTITTKDPAAPGDIVIAEGMISTDKDFGAGYVYEVIMEDATIKTE